MLNFCPYCGTKIVRQDVRFCMSCGKSLAEFMGAPVDEKTPEAAPPKVDTTRPPKINTRKAPKVDTTRPPKVNTQKAPKVRATIPSEYKAEKPPTTNTAELPNVNAKKSSTPRKSNVQSLEDELVKCRAAAEDGYILAKENFDEIQSTLNDAEKSLRQTDREQNQVERIQNTNLVNEQRDELHRLKKQIATIGDDLNFLRERSQEFSIVVYGRTMAGKSTLMEILTHGNGSSIGKGAQRTTLDVSRLSLERLENYGRARHFGIRRRGGRKTCD